VHKEAGMVLHASQHRPSTQDHSSYLHSHDRHYIRNNCEAACHSARFVRHEKELAALQQKAAIEIYSVGAN
jgi:prephenate dehydratase